MHVTIDHIYQARKVLESVVLRTEIDFSQTASGLLGSAVYFKLENRQYTGSFKFRGAYNKIHSLTEEEKARGVIASSAGNHAQGVARAALVQKVSAKIVMPKGGSLVKAEATRSYGAEVVFYGNSVDEAIEYAKKELASEGRIFIHPYQDPLIIAGQGTIGLELVEAIPDLDTVIVPIGGGGLISGIALAIKSLLPSCRIIGVVSDQAPGMAQLKNSQTPQLPRPFVSTIADGIAVKHPSPVMYENFISRYVDDIVTVSDDEIAEAMVFLMERLKVIAEGSGAAALAAGLFRSLKLGKKTCFLVSGGNLDLNWLEKVILKSQVQRGRLAEIGVSILDLPGQLSRLTSIIADSGANILDVRHDRTRSDLALRETHIHFILETRDFNHIAAIKKTMAQEGFCVL